MAVSSSLCYCLLMLASATVLADFIEVQPEVLTLLGSADNHSSLTDDLNDRLLQQESLVSEDPPEAATAEEEGEDSSQEVEQQIQELKELLKIIRRALHAVEQKKLNWLRLQKMFRSFKRGPANRFLRIGRNGMRNQDVMSKGSAKFHLPEGFETVSSPEVNDILQVLRSLESGINNILKDKTDVQENQGQTQEKAITRFDGKHFPPTGRDWQLWHQRNNFVRFGRSSDPPYTILPIWRSHGKADRVKQSLRHLMPVNRRSYVRIGRLPASVYRRRNDGSQPELESRRSGYPEYRVSKAGVVRMGK